MPPVPGPPLPVFRHLDDKLIIHHRQRCDTGPRHTAPATGPGATASARPAASAARCAGWSVSSQRRVPDTGSRRVSPRARLGRGAVCPWAERSVHRPFVRVKPRTVPVPAAARAELSGYGRFGSIPVLRASPLDPVSGLNRPFGSVATGPPIPHDSQAFHATPFSLCPLMLQKRAVR